MQNKSAFKIIFKVLALIATLILSYIICMILFLVIFGTGGQASQEMNNYGIVIVFIPFIITFFLAYKLFSKKDKN